MNKSSWKVWCVFISKFCDQLLFLLTLFIGSIWRGALWHLIESHYRFLTQWPSNLNIVHYLLKHIRQDGGRGGDTILRINVLNTAHFCILCVLNILCHISCWGSTWKFHVLMLDCGRIWHLWQDVAGATCPASTCCCLQSDRKPGLNYVTEWPTLVFLWN